MSKTKYLEKQIDIYLNFFKRLEILINYGQDKDIAKESHLNYSKFDYIAFFIAWRLPRRCNFMYKRKFMSYFYSFNQNTTSFGIKEVTSRREKFMKAISCERFRISKLKDYFSKYKTTVQILVSSFGFLVACQLCYVDNRINQ